MSVSERIQKGLVKPGSIYARFGEITPFKTPRDEQVAVWQVSGPHGKGLSGGGVQRGQGGAAAQRRRRWQHANAQPWSMRRFPPRLAVPICPPARTPACLAGVRLRGAAPLRAKHEARDTRHGASRAPGNSSGGRPCALAGPAAGIGASAARCAPGVAGGRRTAGALLAALAAASYAHVHARAGGRGGCGSNSAVVTAGKGQWSRASSAVGGWIAIQLSDVCVLQLVNRCLTT